jgi:hypothetical protein
MSQTIVTKFLGPTNYRGSRVKATAAAGSVTVEWNHGLCIEANHRTAALALASRHGWSPNMVGGRMPPPGSGYVFVYPV